MGSLRKKIVVVGGGVLGTALAWRLAEAGFQVDLLERHDLGGGASGGNLSQISIVDRLEDWHIAITLKTLEMYGWLKEEKGMDYQVSGGMTVLRNPVEMQAAEKAAAALAHYQIPGQVMTDWKEISKIEPELCPEAAMGVLYCAHEGKVDAFATTLLFARLAQEAGAQLHTHTPVEGFVLQGGCIQEVRTPKGNFAADVVINAAGPWSPRVAALAGQALPIHWHRGTALVSRPMPPVVHCTLVGGGFLLAEAAGATPENGLRIGLGMLQNSHGSIFLSQATNENPEDDREVELKGMALIAQQALRYFPRLENLEVLRAWSAPTTYTVDGAPFFGFCHTPGNLFTCAGFKGAFSTALGVAEETVKTLKGEASVLGDFASPEREGAGKECH